MFWRIVASAMLQRDYSRACVGGWGGGGMGEARGERPVNYTMDLSQMQLCYHSAQGHHGVMLALILTLLRSNVSVSNHKLLCFLLFLLYVQEGKAFRRRVLRLLSHALLQRLHPQREADNGNAALRGF